MRTIRVTRTKNNDDKGKRDHGRPREAPGEATGDHGRPRTGHRVWKRKSTYSLGEIIGPATRLSHDVYGITRGVVVMEPAPLRRLRAVLIVVKFHTAAWVVVDGSIVAADELRAHLCIVVPPRGVVIIVYAYARVTVCLADGFR